MIYNIHIASLSIFTKKEIIADTFEEAKKIGTEKMLQLAMLSNEEILFSFDGEGTLYSTNKIQKEEVEKEKKLEMVTV